MKSICKYVILILFICIINFWSIFAKAENLTNEQNRDAMSVNIMPLSILVDSLLNYDPDYFLFSDVLNINSKLFKLDYDELNDQMNLLFAASLNEHSKLPKNQQSEFFYRFLVEITVNKYSSSDNSMFLNKKIEEKPNASLPKGSKPKQPKHVPVYFFFDNINY